MGDESLEVVVYYTLTETQLLIFLLTHFQQNWVKMFSPKKWLFGRVVPALVASMKGDGLEILRQDIHFPMGSSVQTRQQSIIFLPSVVAVPSCDENAILPFFFS